MAFHREPSMPELEKPPWIWVWLLLVTGAAGLLAVYFAWDAIPDPFPSHWNARGEADGFMEKTWKQMFFMFGLPSLIFTAVVAGSFALLHQHAKHQRGEEWKIARSRAMSNKMMKPLGLWMFVLNAIIMSSIYFSITTEVLSTPVLIVGIFVVVVLLLWNMAKVQQWLDENYPDPKRSKHMKWGMFYYNPEDPNMMVHGDLNSTFNMAHKGSWVAMGALLGLPVILVAALIILGL